MPCPKRFAFAKVISSSAFAVMSCALAGCQVMNGHAANNLGSAYYREGNYAAARQSFYQAVAEMPENADFRYNLAAAMQKQGDLAGAEQIYRQVLQVDPSHQPSYHGMAQLMIQQGRQAEAEQMMNTWVATQPYSPTPHIEMAWLHEQQGNQYAAAQSLQQALQIQPNNPVALAHLGQVYQESGQPELAAAYYQRSLQANWRQPEVQNRLAAISPNTQGQQQPTQVAFGVPQGMIASGQPMPPQMAWLPPQNQVAAFSPMPSAAPIPNGMIAHAPALSPQIQTTWMPPQMAGPHFAGPQFNGPQLAMQGQPTPVMVSQQPTPIDPALLHSQGPTPTFVSGPANADPAHIPPMTAELPVVRPY